jgi:hypothetical protein
MSEAQIEQIWYTWSKRGLEGKGLGVRAASRALQDLQSPRVLALIPHIRSYQLPSDFDPYATHQEDAPVCLAFFKEGNDLVLLQKQFLEKLDDRGRAGLFFVHALVGFPAYFSAREAISLWKSPFWVMADTYDPAAEKPLAEEADELGSIPYVPPTPRQRVYQPGNLPLLRKYLNSKLPSLAGQEENLSFVLQAFLMQRRAQEQGQKAPKMYIAAFPDTVAALLQGLTHALPRSLLGGLTFSTYEQRVEQSPAMIVGTCRLSMRTPRAAPSPAQASLLSPAEYQGQALVLNSDTQEHSPLRPAGPLEARFVKFAAESLVSGSTTDLRELVNKAESRNLTTIDAFLNFFEREEKAKAHQLSQEDVFQILCDPLDAAEKLPGEWVREIALKLILDDAWWKRGVKAAMEGLSTSAQPGDALDRSLGYLALGVINSDGEILQDGLAWTAAQTLEYEEERALVWLRRLDAFAPPARQPLVWQYLVQWMGTYQPRTVTFADRSWLLRRWQQAKPDLDSSYVRPWLEVNLADLPGLLALKLPDPWNLVALDPLVRSDAKTVARILAKHPGLAEQVLKRLILERQGAIAQDFFAEYLSPLDATARLSLLDRLFDPRQGDAEMAHGLLRVAHLTAPELSALLAKVDHLVFQKALSSLLADHDWWQAEGREVCAEMRRQADAGHKPQAEALSLLEKPVSARLREVLESLYARPQEEPNQQAAVDLLELLAFAAPPSRQRETWLRLLPYVTRESSTRFSWAIRSRLLSSWALLSPLPEQQAVRPWLEVGWEEFGPLFSLKLDDTWMVLALLALLERLPEEQGVPFNRQTSVDGVAVVKEHAARFEGLLLKIVKDHAGMKEQDRRRRRQVASFFSSLAASDYPQAEKMRLLYGLLRADEKDGELIELLLRGANFSTEELNEFVEGPYLEWLIRWNPLHATLVSWMTVYLHDLSADDRERLVAQDFKPLSVLKGGVGHEPGNQQGKLIAAFAALARKAFDGVAAALGTTIDEPLGTFWLNILDVAAPPASNEGHWRPFIHYLEPARPRLSPALRHALLQRWALLPSVDFSLLVPWLQVPWQELDDLLACRLPAEWYQVTYLALLKGQAVPLNQLEAKLFMGHAPELTSCLQNLILEKTPWSAAARSYMQTFPPAQPLWGVAVNFFWQLAAAPAAAECKLGVLITLLQSAAEQDVVVIGLLQGAQLQMPNEGTALLGSSARWLVRWPDLPAPLADVLERYLSSLQVDALWQPDPARLLEAVLALPEKGPSTKLQRVQVVAGCWRLVGRFIASPTLEKEALETLASTFQYLPADRLADIFAALARTLTASIGQEAQMRLVLSTLGPGWREKGYSLLEHLAVSVGGASSSQQYPPQRLALYAQAICEEAAVAPTAEQQQTTLDWLNTLLASVGKEAKVGIDAEAEGWSSAEARLLWQTYRQRRKPLHTLRRGLRALGEKVSPFRFFRRSPAPLTRGEATPLTRDFPTRKRRSQASRPGGAASTAQEDGARQQAVPPLKARQAAARSDLPGIQARAAQQQGKTPARVAPSIAPALSSPKIADGGAALKKSGAGAPVSAAAPQKMLPARSGRPGKPGLRQQLSQRLSTWQGKLIFCLFLVAFISVFALFVWAVTQQLLIGL